MKESKTVDFIDEKGYESIMTLEGDKNKTVLSDKYKLQSPEAQKKINAKFAKGIFTSDIGIHSSGFAGIMGLALIISLAGVIIAYLVLKY